MTYYCRLYTLYSVSVATRTAKTMSMTIEQFEIARNRFGLSYTDFARLINVAQPRMVEWSKGKSSIPGYVEASINAHLLLPADALELLKKARGVGAKAKARRTTKAKSERIPAAA